MTKIYAHRGGAGNAPENTMEAFRLAFEHNADGLELDVHLSKDDKLVVCHDFTIDRTTNGKGLIRELTYEEIKKYNANKKFKEKFPSAKVPLLEEVLTFAKACNLELNVELKAGSNFYPLIEEKTINLLKQYGLLEKTIISSFDHRALINVKKIDKKIKVGALYEAYLLNAPRYAKKYKFNALHPQFLAVDKSLIDECHRKNIMVNCYTVNEEEMAKYLISLNTDIIITNFPDKLKSL